MLIIYLATDLYQCFFLIANDISTDWTKLAARLDPRIDINAIIADNAKTFDRAMEFLMKFYNKHKSVASFDQLIWALNDIDRPDIVDILKNDNAC